jgi:uncharacterized membrane protein
MKQPAAGRCVFLLVLSALGCAKSGAQPESENAKTAQARRQTSFANDIQPLLAARCAPCHAVSKQGRARRGAPPGVDLDTYAAAREHAEDSNELIQDGSMPPAGSLSAEQRALFQAWVKQGMPR